VGLNELFSGVLFFVSSIFCKTIGGAFEYEGIRFYRVLLEVGDVSMTVLYLPVDISSKVF
jgi:hypothetical protein